MSTAVPPLFPPGSPAAAPRLRRLLATSMFGLLAAGTTVAAALPPACEGGVETEADCRAAAPAATQEPGCTASATACEAQQSLPAESQPVALPRITSSPLDLLLPAEGRPPEAALLQARLVTPAASGYLDAVLSTETGGRFEARGMGLQLRLPERGGEVMLGRYVSGGAGLRPDLPIVGMRYSSRAAPQPAAAAPAAKAPRSVGHRIALPAGAGGAQAGSLEVKMRELRGKAPTPVAGTGLRLLPHGAHDVSLEAGLLAQDAERFDSTGIPAASLTVRHGWRAQQTLSARAVQAGDSLLLAGLSEFRMMGVATAGAIVRERGQGLEPGWLLAHEYEVQGFRSRMRFEGLGSSAEPGGSSLLGAPHRSNAEVALSWALSPGSAITVSAGDRVGLDGERAELLSLSSSVRTRGGEQVSMGLRRARDGSDSTEFSIDWRIPLESRALLRRGGRSSGGLLGGLR